MQKDLAESLSATARGEHLVATGAGEFRQIAAAASANWLWLAAPTHWDRALEVGSSSARLSGALAYHFRAVHQLDAGEADRGSAGLSSFRATDRRRGAVRGVLRESPYRTATFDCVAVHSPLPPSLNGFYRDLLRECARVLRRGGCLYAVCANPFHYRALREWREFRVHRSRLLGPVALRSVGFERVCTYYVFPEIGEPWNLVPTSRHATKALELLFGETTVLTRLRRAVVSAGFHRLAYPWLMYLAYR